MLQPNFLPTSPTNTHIGPTPSMTKLSNYIASLLGSKWEDQYLEQLFNLPVININKYNFNKLKAAKFTVFWGGADIPPSFYNETPAYTSANTPTQRDLLEKTAFEICQFNNISMLGICRGAQLFCALSGGKLWQHVENHNTSHKMIMNDGTVLNTTSVHHQMLRPTTEMKILGTSLDIRSPIKHNEHGPHNTHDPEPEVVFIPKNKALCIQGHPEYTSHKSDLSKLTKHLVEEYL
mgnify:CR=1 FL=1